MLENIIISQSKFWDKAANKEFNDPFYLERLQPYINDNSLITEYGCGYGRLLNLLHQNGFQNTLGFDFSQGMIARGMKQYPHLRLQLIDKAHIPLPDETAEAAILSTVLCCIPDNTIQKQIIQEVLRVLKPAGVLYLTDFLITDTKHMNDKYQSYSKISNEWGIYQTTEGAIVRHFSEEHISNLLNKFTVQWYQQENFITMNNNPVKTFHGIYKKN